MTDTAEEDITPEPSGARASWLPLAALAVAVIALGVGVFGLVRAPAAAHEAAPTDSEVAEAKTRACTAFDVVRGAVSRQTHGDLGPDPVAVQAVAANARLAMATGSDYLRTHLGPAAPAELATAVTSFADTLAEIAMYAQAGVTDADSTQAARLRDGQATSERIAGLCAP